MLMNNNKNGITLVELVISVFISGIVVFIVMFFWLFVFKHTLFQKNKNIFYIQTEQTFSLIVNEIRKSIKVIRLDTNYIRFINAKNNDTVEYFFSFDTLWKNKTPLQLPLEETKIKCFYIDAQKINTDFLEKANDSLFLLLNITLCAEYRAKIQSKLKNTVKIKYQPEDIFYPNYEKN